jgi:hypothetical protein
MQPVSKKETSGLVWDGRQPEIRTVGAMSQLWDIRLPVRTLAENIFTFRYQETSNEEIEEFLYGTVIFRVYKPVRLLY